MNENTNQATPSQRQWRFQMDVTVWALIVITIFYGLAFIAEIAVAAGWLQAAPITNLFSSYKSDLLPIVTLILGHYFGRRSQQ